MLKGSARDVVAASAAHAHEEGKPPQSWHTAASVRQPRRLALAGSRVARNRAGAEPRYEARTNASPCAAGRSAAARRPPSCRVALLCGCDAEAASLPWRLEAAARACGSEAEAASLPRRLEAAARACAPRDGGRAERARPGSGRHACPLASGSRCCSRVAATRAPVASASAARAGALRQRRPGWAKCTEAAAAWLGRAAARAPAQEHPEAARARTTALRAWATAGAAPAVGGAPAAGPPTVALAAKAADAAGPEAASEAGPTTAARLTAPGEQPPAEGCPRELGARQRRRWSGRHRGSTRRA